MGKYTAATKPIYFAFIDLEKDFDHVPRKVLWWALRSLGIGEWAVHAIQYMYSRSCVRANGQYSEEFGMAIVVRQGSALSPQLFILVLEALLHEFRTGVLWELLYADDPVLITDTQEECISSWRQGSLA